MTVTIFPPPDLEPWPTLGSFVCAFIEDELCHGPGDLLGQPVTLSEEMRAWIYRMYEIEPPWFVQRKRGIVRKDKNPRAGARRFERCVLSLRKGSSKTELAAWIAACELHRDGPVRCAGFTKGGEPIPRGVTDPYIPMISYTEEQTEELAYGALRRILEHCSIGRDFDVGLQRIMRVGGDGKAEAVSGSPNARDGARTTFQHADETHRFILDHLRRAWAVMLANLAKRPIADPWALETTTAPEPGSGSVAEATMEHVRIVMAQHGRSTRSRLFFFHREASAGHDLSTRTGLAAAVAEASGPYIARWTDVDRIVERFFEPDADRAYLERVWLNRPVQASAMAFDLPGWVARARTDYTVPEGSAITLGFDGSRYDDATALVATHILSGYQWPLGIWTPDQAGEIPVSDVDGVVADAFARWDVTRMYCDPPKWEGWIAAWAGRYGEKIVLEWWTNRRKPMAYAIRAFGNAIATGELSHSGDPVLTAHLGHACRRYTGLADEENQPLWILRKERPDSPLKIDGVMAAVLSWEARNDALATGVAERAAGDYGITVGVT